MAFPNLKRILRSSTGRDKIKLVLLAAAFSRPRFRGAALLMLRPFIRNGELPISYRDGGRTLVVYLRQAELQSAATGTDDFRAVAPAVQSFAAGRRR